MKIRNYLTILFAVVAIVVLLGLAGFMTLYVADSSNPIVQQVIQILQPDGAETAEGTAPDTNPEQDAQPVDKEHAFVFVGDSRTIGMRDAVGDGCTYIGSEGEGYNWFAEDGIASLQAVLDSNPQQKVIFNLGVNDPENISLYIDLYNTLITEYPDTSFYMLSVNPLVDGEGFNTTNEMIELFNATLKNAFPNNYLDSYAYLIGSGFETVDGLHYTEETYRAIHNYVVDLLA